MQIKYVLAAAGLLSFIMSVQASQNSIQEYKSPCIGEVYVKMMAKSESQTPHLWNFAIKQKMDECQKLGEGTPADQVDKIIDLGIEKKNKKVVEDAVILKYESRIINQASSNAWKNAGFQCIAIAAGYVLRMVIEKK